MKRSIFKSPIVITISTIVLALGASSCDQLERHSPQKYFSETRTSKKDEFRWSNGSQIKTLDPSKALSAPESDVVKAIYEGLTDSDPETLDATPSVARSWTQSEDGRVWIFTLRDDARWSNGDVVTAHDFIRSWKRLPSRDLPDSFARLVGNIEGLSEIADRDQVQRKDGDPVDGATVAVDDFLLQVSLIEPDPDLPKILSHQIFRPVHSGFAADSPLSEATLPITNGAFRIVSLTTDEIVLERSPLFWGADDVEVATVRFVMSENAEKALDEYRAGRLDAVTNFEFEPLALKLLSSYSDFQRSTHAAVNLYEFNTARAPFSDERVREAFAVSIARDLLVQSETAGAMKPATSLAPFIEKFGTVAEDPERAKQLMSDAGFPGGKDFPTVVLVINRNDLQVRVARFIARSWKNVLGVDVRVEIRELTELEGIRASGQFDIIRRGIVFPTSSIKAAQDLIFDEGNFAEQIAERRSEATTESGERVTEKEEIPFALTALYFPKSYSLMKPSVKGFSVNSFGASSLKQVRTSK